MSVEILEVMIDDNLIWKTDVELAGKKKFSLLEFLLKQVVF